MAVRRARRLKACIAPLKPAYFRVWQSRSGGLWLWTLYDRRGRFVGGSPQYYTSRAKALRALDRYCDAAWEAMRRDVVGA